MITRILAAPAAIVMLVAGCSSGEATLSDRDTGQTTPAPAQTAPLAGSDGRSSAAGSAADDEGADEASRPEQEEGSNESAGAAPAPDGEAIEVGASLEPPPAELLLEPATRGDSGAEVETLQNRLAELGFAPGASDGDYGARTAAAVAAFQALVGLDPTGDADRLTVQALVDYRYDGLVVRAGDEGPKVEELQRQLAKGPFDPGPADGEYGRKTTAAVWALEKLAGIPVDGDWGPLDAAAWELLVSGEIGEPAEDHDVRWVEFDLSQQLVKIYDPGSSAPTLISHASSGSGIPWVNEDHSGSSITPIGDFAINRRIAGWRESSLGIGRLYNPLYFNGGIAFHGSQSVPLYPASHGCVRLPMHIAEYLPEQLPNGTPVHVVE
ncbi:MAG: L,D-transpeptidase family protein [Acidimicrobiia bacterium]|nr:L,D-transpeptidase family protein [Acidimicrobiia bacterium]